MRAFLRALTKGVKEVLADPDGSIKCVKERDGIIDEALERRRLNSRSAARSTPPMPAATASAMSTDRGWH